MKGKLIVLEGIDGSGKTTQAGLLKDFMASRKMFCEVLHYPDHTGPIGRLIVDYLREKYDFSPEIQFLLYTSDMIKDKERISRWLNSGTCVIADRFFTSTIAYQCMVKGFPLEKAISFAELFNMPKPDRIIYLRITPETSARRKAHQEQDRHERDRELNTKLSNLFEELAERQTWSSWFPVDGEKPVEEVFEQVKKILKPLIPGLA